MGICLKISLMIDPRKKFYNVPLSAVYGNRVEHVD